MDISEEDLNKRLFKAFLLGKHVALETFNVHASPAEDSTYDRIAAVANGTRSSRPDIEQMIAIVPDAKKAEWRSLLEASRPALEVEYRAIATCVVAGMNDYFRL